MIRFVPDSWLDVLLRPLDMISPEANTYVEIAAPDIRLAVVLLLGLVATCCSFRLARPRLRPPFVLLTLLLLAAVPWLSTTGNGRYFIPFLLILGPLYVGLLTLLPVTAGFRLAAACILVGLQVFLISQATPWRAWALGVWEDGTYFSVDSPAHVPGARYVSISNISFSLIAPQFPADARWLNLASGFPGPLEQVKLYRFLAGSGPLFLVAPSLPSQTLPDYQPNERVVEALQQLIRPHGLSLVRASKCEYVGSDGLAGVIFRTAPKPERQDRAGFWLCPMVFDQAEVKSTSTETADVDRVFVAVETLCPRFFRSDGSSTLKIAGGYVRHYNDSDTKVYIYDSGLVVYKFWRSINAVPIGRAEEVLSGKARIDCEKIRAPNWRRGGP